MVIQFTLQDLMVFLVCATGILAGAFLLPVLWNMKKMLGILKPLVETNKESINKSIKTVPVILGDMEQISGNVKEATDKLKISLPVMLQEVGYVANAAKGSLTLAGDVMEKINSGINETAAAPQKDNTGYFHLFEELMQLVYRSLTSGK